MKKLKTTILMLMLGVLMVIPFTAQAGTDPQITLAVNGKLVAFPDQQPYVDSNNRTMVPVRFPSETLGATVDWIQSSQQVHVVDTAHDSLLDADIMVTINNKDVTVNGATKTMDTTAVITNSRTMVPVRFISEYLGAVVTWDQGSNVAHVFSKGQTEAEQKAIMEQIAKEIKPVVVTPVNRTIGANDSMFVIGYNPGAMGKMTGLIDLYSKDNKAYRWVCTSHEGMNTFHTVKYPSGDPVTIIKGKVAARTFSICGSGYDTPVIAGMKLTYDVYDASDNLVRTVDFQL